MRKALLFLFLKTSMSVWAEEGKEIDKCVHFLNTK